MQVKTLVNITQKCLNRNVNGVDSSKFCRRYLFQSSNRSQESQVVYLREKYKKKSPLSEYDETEDVSQYTKEKGPTITVSAENQYDILSDVVTPWWKIPYSEQLKRKWRWSRYVLNQFTSKRSKTQCYIEDVIPSPNTEGYRNKSEMNIRKGIDGNMKTVGYFIGAPGVDKDKVICVPPTHLVNIPQSHKDITQLYQDFIRSSPLPALHDLYDGGFWKGIVIRTNNTSGGTMVVAFVHPQQFTDEEINDNVLQLKEYFEQNITNITSLYYQKCPQVRCSAKISPFRLLSGKPYLIETIHDYKFRISPESFFQINKSAAELLYQNVLKLAQLKPNTVLLDLCCGTGTISILCSPYVRCCVGIETMSQAVDDAWANAKLNNVTNCQFIEGKIEDTLHKVLKSLNHASDVVAIVNPARNGVQPSIIKAIRYCKQISKLIYISCKADAPGTLSNFSDLCDIKLCNSQRFLIKNITPVDLFPHTHHCELVMLFER